MTTGGPRTLKELVLADLYRAQRLMVRVGDEIDPQFRIASPKSDHWIAMTLPDDGQKRAERFALLSDFMAWMMSPGFVMAAENAEPDAVYAMGVTVTGECAAAIAIMSRGPITFSDPIWLDQAQIGEDMLGLLPRGSRTLSTERIAELKAWFGPAGKYPAIRIEASRSGEDRDSD